MRLIPPGRWANSSKDELHAIRFAVRVPHANGPATPAEHPRDRRGGIPAVGGLVGVVLVRMTRRDMAANDAVPVATH